MLCYIWDQIKCSYNQGGLKMKGCKIEGSLYIQFLHSLLLSDKIKALYILVPILRQTSLIHNLLAFSIKHIFRHTLKGGTGKHSTLSYSVYPQSLVCAVAHLWQGEILLRDSRYQNPSIWQHARKYLSNSGRQQACVVPWSDVLEVHDTIIINIKF